MSLTIDLPPEREAELRAQAEAAGVSAEDFAAKALNQALALAEAEHAPKERSVSELVRELWADVPDDVRAKLPRDGASEHDHYIYGWPKKRP